MRGAGRRARTRWRWRGPTARRLGLSASSSCAADLLDGGPLRRGAGEPALRAPTGRALAPEIAGYEPAGALFAGADGLDLIRRLVARWLGGPVPALVALEIGPGPGGGGGGAAARGRLRDRCECLRDLAGHRARGGRARAVSAARRTRTFERCIAVGGVAVFPADTVYGLACDPDNRVAVERLYALKRRPLDKPSAVMFFSLGAGAGGAARARRRARAAALERLLPGRGDAAAAEPGAAVPAGLRRRSRTLGLRVRCVPDAAPASAGRCCSRARTSPAGRTPAGWTTCPRRSAPRADLVIDGGELPGTPSTVVDLRGYEATGAWRIVRAGGGGRGGASPAALEVAVSLRSGDLRGR